MDTIPLHEIVSVTSELKRKRTNSIISIGSNSERIPNSLMMKRAQSSFLLRSGISPGQDGSGQTSNVLQIKTIPEGFNSGRTYALKTCSEEQLLEITVQLEKIAVAARNRAEAKSRLRKSQDSVRQAYCSLAFQCCVALLIVAVSAEFGRIFIAFLFSCFDSITENCVVFCDTAK